MKIRNVTRGLCAGLALATTLTPIAVWADGIKAESKPVVFQPLPPGDSGNLPESEIMTATWKTDPAPDIRAFAGWVEKFLAAPPADQLILEDEGVELAKARQKVIKEQIVTDPRRALANAVPITIRKQLPHQVVRYLEKRIDTFGDWGTQCSMPLPGSGQGDATDGKNGSAVASETEVADVGGQTFQAHHYGQRSARFVQGGSLHGIAVDDELAVLNSPLRALEEGEMPRGSTVDFCKVKVGHSSVSGGSKVGSSFGGPRPLRFYQIGGSMYGKSDDAAKTELVEAGLKAKQNGYKDVRETITSGDGWMPSEELNYLGDSGAPGSSGMPGKPPVSHTHGNKTVLIIRVQSPGHQLDPWLLNNTNLANQATDINARYSYISNNRVSITFAYTPVYNLAASFDAFNADAWHDAARARAQSDGYNLNNYQVHAVIHGGADTGYGGLMAANKMWLNNTFGQFVFIHEFGHYLSLPHSGLFQVTDGNPMSPNRTNITYGDGYCYMGASYNNYSLGTYNPAYINKLSWSYNSDIQTVTRSGTYTFHQYDGGVQGRILALKVPRDSNTNYWLSIRGNVDAGGVLHSNGVAIRTQNAWNPNDTILVDMHPNDGASENAPLGINEEWYDSAADLRFKTLSVQGTTPNRSITVQITFGPTHSAAYRPLVNGGIYRFQNRANPGISLSGVATTANVPVVMAANNDNSAQQKWVANRNSDGSYSFNLLGTDKWLDFYTAVYTAGSDIYQHAASNADSQKVYVSETPDGYISLGHKNGESNTIYVIDMNTANNDVRQWTFDSGIPNGAPQQWKPELIGLMTNRNYRLIPNNAQAQALDVNGTNPNNGSPVTIHTWNAGTNQQWSFESVTGGYRFRSPYSPSRVLDIDPANGKAQIYDMHGGTNQAFNLARSGGHWVRLIPGYNTGLSLEATGGTSNGTPVNAKPENGGNNQRWRFADVDG
jgi:hypothetical protein